MVCLTQMYLDVRLERIWPAPWGFTLTGGVETRRPITVAEVCPSSPASRSGLAPGDEVLAINSAPTEDLSGQRAHDLVAQTPLCLHLKVIRTIGWPPVAATSPFEPEVPAPPDRSKSPFERPSTPYRPFSTEPPQDIPPLERPIILSPFYRDDFSKIQKRDCETPTRFKLEISKSYVPDCKPYDLDADKGYSEMSGEHYTTLEELNTEIDMNEMESALFSVEDNVTNSFMTTEDDKVANGYIVTEETKVVSEHVMEIIESEVIENIKMDGGVSASLLTQLLDQTADEISRKAEIEQKEKCSKKSETSEVESLLKKEVKQESAFSIDQNISTEAQSGVKEKREKCDREKLKLKISTNESKKNESNEFIEEESKSAKEIIKDFNAKAEEENKTKKTEIKSSSKKDEKRTSEQRFSETQHETKQSYEKKHVEELKRSIDEIKQQTINTDNLSAEQRTYTLGLQTIPNIKGHAHSSYHYDLLLKTFFIHLTDVMVALSRIILADGQSRSVSPLPPKKENDKTTQNVTTQTLHTTQQSSNTEHSSSSNVVESKIESTENIEMEHKKLSAAKLVQKSQLKSEELTQKMDAVISEFSKKGGQEIEEHDILCEKEELSKEDNLLETSESGNVNGKIIYVATVEAKQIPHIDDNFIELEERKETITSDSLSLELNNCQLFKECQRKFSQEQYEIVKDIALSTVDDVIQDIKVSELTKAVEEIQVQSVAIEEKITDRESLKVNVFEERRLSISKQAEEIKSDSSLLETVKLERKESFSQEIVKQETTAHLETSTVEKTVETEIKPQFDARRLSQEMKPTFDARRLSQDKSASLQSSRKGSVSESVRSDLQSRKSSSSEDSWVPIPETPLTDEYIFRLKLPLEESKNPLPPSPPTEHEDPNIVKKPKLIPHIDTTLESPKLYEGVKAPMFDEAYKTAVDPKKQTNAYVSNETNNANSIYNPLSNSIPPHITNDDFKSSNESKTFQSEMNSTETKRRKSANFLEESLVQRTVEEKGKSTGLCDRTSNQNVFEGDLVKHNCGIVTRNNNTVTHHGGLVKHAYTEPEASKAEDETTVKSEMEKHNCGIIAKKDGVVTHHGGLIKRNVLVPVKNVSDDDQTGAIVKDKTYHTEDTQITKGSVNVHGGLVKRKVFVPPRNLSNDLNNKTSTEIEHISETISSSKEETNIEEHIRTTTQSSTFNQEIVQKIATQSAQNSFSYQRLSAVVAASEESAKTEKYNCGIVAKSDGPVTYHGGLVSQVAVKREGQLAQVVKRNSIQNGGSTAYGASDQNGGFCQNGGFNQNVSRVAVDFSQGTTQGIVDAPDNAGILDEELAKQLGKPGLTEEKIAELMSGESEMLKEAHVIGLRRVLASHMNRLNEDEDSVDFKKIKPQIESLKDSEVLKALNEELTRTKEEKKKEERKWTTFLQRPDRAIPSSRFDWKSQEKAEPYRIKIVKQPKPKVAPDYKPQDWETGLLPWEERAAREPPAPPVPREEPVLVPEEPPLFLEAVDNLPESAVPDLEDTGIPLPPDPIEPEFDQPELSEELVIERTAPEDLAQLVQEGLEVCSGEEIQEEEMEQKQLTDKILETIQSMVDPKAPMEEQLVQMRAQLSALAELPTVISQTLLSLTSQLAHLTTGEKEQLSADAEGGASETGAGVSEMEGEVSETQREVSETQLEVCEMGEGEIASDASSQAIEVVEEKASQQATAPADLTENRTSEPPVPGAQAEQREDATGQAETALRRESNHMTQDMIEIQKREVMAELQREHISRQVKHHPTPRPAFGPRVPQERPLVLPGGRKWRGPKDAFNEDFIRETLAAQAEVIQGKTKGINFLKWEKPARTLDHLKDSDVYKLIHDMAPEPPKKVETLPPIVIAESEYREKSSRIREILLANGLPIQAEPENNPCRRLQACPKTCRDPTERKKVSFQDSNENSEFTIEKCPKICSESVVTVSSANTPIVCAKVCPQMCPEIAEISKDIIDSAQCNKVCPEASKCPQICGGILPEFCNQNDDIETSAEMTNDDIKTSEIEEEAEMHIILNDTIDGIPRAKDLVVPPSEPKVEMPPRPSSWDEAVEIVINYVETHSAKESRSKPACELQVQICDTEI